MSLPKLRILVSYYYLRMWGVDSRIFLHTLDDQVEWLIDSGAFTAYYAAQRQGVPVDEVISLDEYCAWLEPLQDILPRYIALDVIRDAEGTQRNLAVMVARGLTPMPVVTPFHDLALLPELEAINPYLCVSGGSNASKSWIKSRFARIGERMAEGTKLHGLAYVKYPEFLQLPLHSVDSSSWTAGARWGTMQRFSAARGIQEVKGRAAEQLLHRRGIPSKQYAPDLHRGFMNPSAFVTMLAHLEYHDYVLAQGKKLFLVVGVMDVLAGLLAARDAQAQGGDFFYARRRYAEWNTVLRGLRDGAEAA